MKEELFAFEGRLPYRSACIRRREVDHWPHVRDGLFTRDEALLVFDRILEGRAHQEANSTRVAESFVETVISRVQLEFEVDATRSMTMVYKRPPKSDFDTFRRQGYLIIRNFFDAHAVAQARQISNAMSAQAAAILDECARTGQNPAARATVNTDELIVVPEAGESKQVCRYEYMIGSSQAFADLIETEVLPIVDFVFGEPAVVFKDKTNEKLPGGGGFRPHQDFVAYQHFPPRYNVTAMLSIDASSSENGCLQFASNFDEVVSHTMQAATSMINGHAILPYESGGGRNGDISAWVANQISWSEVETGPADLVIFDSFVPHYSKPNSSYSPRRAIFTTFTRLSEGRWYDTYYERKRTNYLDPIFHVSTPTVHEGLSND